MEIYGKPMEHLWENDGFGTQNPLAAIGIPRLTKTRVAGKKNGSWVEKNG